MASARRISKKHIGRPVDFHGFDDVVYNGRIVDVARRHFLVFVYYVRGVEIRNVLDLRKHRERILEVW